MHANVPDEQTSYEQGGWHEYYFEPMKEYLSSPERATVHAKAKPAAAKTKRKRVATSIKSKRKAPKATIRKKKSKSVIRTKTSAKYVKRAKRKLGRAR